MRTDVRPPCKPRPTVHGPNRHSPCILDRMRWAWRRCTRRLRRYPLPISNATGCLVIRRTEYHTRPRSQGFPRLLRPLPLGCRSPRTGPRPTSPLPDILSLTVRRLEVPSCRRTVLEARTIPKDRVSIALRVPGRVELRGVEVCAAMVGRKFRMRREP